MLMTAKLIGTGKSGDNFRVDFPTYIMVDVDYDKMTALVEIPDESMPPVIRNAQAKQLKTGDTTADVKAVRTTDHARITAHIRSMYSEGFSSFEAAEVFPVN